MKGCASNSRIPAGSAGALRAAYACISCGLRRFFHPREGLSLRACAAARGVLRERGAFLCPLFAYRICALPTKARLGRVFDGLSLELDDSWNLALTGRNGRGKTTLLKLLSSELDAGGSIHATTRFARFPFAVADDSLTTGAIVAAVCGAEGWRIEREAG